jgi:hypothetical protein
MTYPSYINPKNTSQGLVVFNLLGETVGDSETLKNSNAK